MRAKLIIHQVKLVKIMLKDNLQTNNYIKKNNQLKK